MNFDNSYAADLAQKLARRFEAVESQTGSATRIVFAESCTCGLVAALLGQVPGISKFLCGSMVTYRESAKQQWLSVSSETLQCFTAESIQTSQAMATNVLVETKEANLSAAVTGHLGPSSEGDSLNQKDGKIFIVVARRTNDSAQIVSTETVQLNSATRIDRQFESAAAVLKAVYQAMA